MTNQEAIEVIKGEKKSLQENPVLIVNSVLYEALDMAIKALEQEPCEDCRNCKKWGDCECGRKGHINGTSIGYLIGECKDYEPSGDLISRQAVIEQINCWIGSGEYRYTNATHYLTERVKHIPSAKQEPKTGHWILDDTDNSITCDKCGCLIWANDISNGDTHYCPHCGCRMESEG